VDAFVHTVVIRPSVRPNIPSVARTSHPHLLQQIQSTNTCVLVCSRAAYGPLPLAMTTSVDYPAREESHAGLENV
jgi:hypothetical protein